MGRRCTWGVTACFEQTQQIKAANGNFWGGAVFSWVSLGPTFAGEPLCPPEYRVHFCRPVAEGPWLELEIQPFSEVLRCFIFAHYYIQFHTKIIDKGEYIVTKSQSVVT